MSTTLDAAGPSPAPWDELWDAYSRLDEAKRDRELAAEKGLNEHELRYRDWWVEVQEEWVSRARVRCAELLLFLFRVTLDTRPDELWWKVLALGVRMQWKEAWVRFMGTQPGGANWCAGLEQTVREQDAEVARLRAELKKARGQTWRLANAVAALEQRIDDAGRTTDADQAHRRTREAVAERPGGAGGAVERRDVREAG